MNRHKLLALAALLVVPLAACDEGTSPPPEGTINGTVSIEGQGIDGVTVSLGSAGTATTAGGGRFSFTAVEAGSYTVTISNFPGDATFTSTSSTAVIDESGETVTVNFDGTYIRTATIMGSVTVEQTGLSGVTIRISGMATETTSTQSNGSYAFTGLRAGTYTVEISNFDNDAVGFSSTSKAVTVGVGESEVASFEGTYLRTAGIVGRVAVEGSGLGGVTVSLSGLESMTVTTDDAGQYAFNELRAGDYTVGISGYDPDDYEFEETSKSVSVALDEQANVPFDGTLLRTAGISGRVSIEGDGLEDVMVSVSMAGTEMASATTDASGQYAFSGLEPGDYTVMISGYDEAAYQFDNTSMDVTLVDGQAVITDFAGTHTRSASVSGYLYLDANMDDMFDMDAEAAMALAGVPVLLVGPELSDRTVGMTDDAGMFVFENLMKGEYQVIFSATLAAQILGTITDMYGASFGGVTEGYLVEVMPGGSAAQHLPFDIITQTLSIQALMGDGNGATGDAVADVQIDLYPTYQAAEAERGEIGERATTTADGMATFKFARASDVGPGGGTDFLVFAKVDEDDLPDDNLRVTANSIVEISYEARTNKSEAPVAVSLLNLGASLQYWVKNIETAVGGDDPQAGWAGEVSGTKGGTALGTQTTSAAGLASFSHVAASVDDLPMTYYVKLATAQSADVTMGESFEATVEASDAATADGDYLVYTNNGLTAPGSAPADLGLLRVKFTTQTLVIGFHHERDQSPKFTSSLDGGDKRPEAGAASALTVELQIRDEYGTPYRYNITDNPRSPDSRDDSKPGLVIFKNLPADSSFIIRARSDETRRILGADELDAYLGGSRETASRGTTSVGAFGAESGTGPQVQLCPNSFDTMEANCSTFAYKYINGTVTGTAQSQNYGSDSVPSHASASGVPFTLVPHKVLGGASDMSGASAAATGVYSITDVPEGRYILTVGDTNDWTSVMAGDNKSDTIIVLVDEGQGVFAATTTVNVTSTYQNTTISGTVVNDANFSDSTLAGDGTVGRGETVEGATLTLSGGGISRTETTDASGKYSFEGVPEGTYTVTGVGTDEYDLYAFAGDSAVAEKTGSIITTALEAEVTGGDDLPYWSYGFKGVKDAERAVVVNSSVQDTDFVVLFKDGVIDGKVVTNVAETGSATKPFAGAEVDVYKCITVEGFNTDISAQPECPGGNDEFFMTAVTGADGTWKIEGVEEGIYWAKVNTGRVNNVDDGDTDNEAGVQKVFGQGAENTFGDLYIKCTGGGCSS